MEQDKNPLEDLSARIEQAEAKREPVDTWGTASRLGWDVAWVVIGGGILGGLIDRMFSTGPWFLLVFLAAGFAVALVRIWRSLRH